MFDQLKRLFGSDSTQDQVAAAPPLDERDFLKQWTTESLDGRRVDVFVPSGDVRPSAVVLFLHGHGRIMLNDNTVFSQSVSTERSCGRLPGRRSQLVAGCDL
jgi:hypothetical protein